MKLPLRIKLLFASPNGESEKNVAYIEPGSDSALKLLEACTEPVHGKTVKWVRFISDTPGEILLRIGHALAILNLSTLEKGTSKYDAAMRELRVIKVMLAIVEKNKKEGRTSDELLAFLNMYK